MMGFEPHHSHTVKERSNLYTDYYGSDLYEEFRQWEQSYDRGYRGTSLNRWGRDMKSLIDQGHVTDWSYFKVGPKTIYRRHRAVDAPHGENTVHTLREMINHRR
jgi:hypothetical protein